MHKRRSVAYVCVAYVRVYRACICARYILHVIRYRDVARHVYRDALANGSPDETTSRLSNCRSCIMHADLCRYLSLYLTDRLLTRPLSLVSLSPLLSRPALAPFSRSDGFRRSPKNKVPDFRGQSCGSAGISCGGDPLSDFLRREQARGMMSP